MEEKIYKAHGMKNILNAVTEIILTYDFKTKKELINKIWRSHSFYQDYSFHHVGFNLARKGEKSEPKPQKDLDPEIMGELKKGVLTELSYIVIYIENALTVPDIKYTKKYGHLPEGKNKNSYVAEVIQKAEDKERRELFKGISEERDL